MIINTIRRSLRLLPSPRFRFSRISLERYTPPASQLEQFKQHISNLDKEQSIEAAAEMYARLQIDEQSYKDKLLQLDEDYKEFAKENPLSAELVERRAKIQNSIDASIQQNKLIEIRYNKEVENVKIYGIIKIAKEVIEISDHISQAKKTLMTSQSQTKEHALQELEKIHSELRRIFHKYHIEEFDPKGAQFNPNEHESIGQIPTQDATLKNTVAETQRSGFKIKDRLLRSAYVMIYS